MFLFLSARGILRIHSDSGNFCFQWFFIFLISHFDICTRFSNWFDVTSRFRVFICHHRFPTANSSWMASNQLVQRLDSEFSLDLRAHCSATIVSRLQSIVHIVGFCGFHFSVHLEIANVVFEIKWNKLVLSILAHQFLEVISHCLTNFAVNRDYVSTIMSQVEILSSHARSLCITTEHLVYPSESSVQRSKQPVLVVSFELPRSTIKNPSTTGCSKESSISCTIWTNIHLECVHCSSCVQVHLHPFKQLRTTRGTEIQTSK